MKIEELKKELEEIEERRFYLDMKDHWSNEDYTKDDELLKRRKEIEEELKKFNIKVYSNYSHDINYKEEQ